jgi:nitroreductase
MQAVAGRARREGGPAAEGSSMITNPVIETLLRRKSVRAYADQEPSDEVIETIVRCGQQAPFAAQRGSLLMSRDRAKNPFRAPLLFTVLADVHRLERVMDRRAWSRTACDGAILLFGVQDAAYMAENMVIAAESLGLGSCYLGGAPFYAGRIVEESNLPPHVFPLVQLAMGYPDEDPPTRPRYPVSFTLFEDRYPELDDATVDGAMAVMDEGYLAQDYYRRAGFMVPLGEGREETFTLDDYSWTEHMGRKWGQWLKDPEELLGPLAQCGFHVEGSGDVVGKEATEDPKA